MSASNPIFQVQVAGYSSQISQRTRSGGEAAKTDSGVKNFPLSVDIGWNQAHAFVEMADSAGHLCGDGAAQQHPFQGVELAQTPNGTVSGQVGASKVAVEEGFFLLLGEMRLNDGVEKWLVFAGYE